MDFARFGDTIVNMPRRTSKISGLKTTFMAELSLNQARIG